MKGWITFHKRSKQIMIQSSSWRMTLETLRFNCQSRSSRGKIRYIKKSDEKYTKWRKQNKAELKEQLRIQEDGSSRNNITVDGIEEGENETWENTENKLRSFMYDELEITD